MKKQQQLLLMAGLFLFSCNNSNDHKSTVPASKDSASVTSQKASTTDEKTSAASGPRVTFTVEGREMTIRNTILVSKDKKAVSPGNDYIAQMIGNSHDSDKVSLVLRIAFALQPGTYPVVGYSYQHKVNGREEIFGGILGGATEISPYKVNLSSCEKIRDHHWKIAGNIDQLTIPINNIMKLDMKVKHPESVTISKISFADMEFDDNLEELMNKIAEKKQ